jgi:hypothetical protein
VYREQIDGPVAVADANKPTPRTGERKATRTRLVNVGDAASVPAAQGPSDATATIAGIRHDRAKCNLIAGRPGSVT